MYINDDNNNDNNNVHDGYISETHILFNTEIYYNIVNDLERLRRSLQCAQTSLALFFMLQFMFWLAVWLSGNVVGQINEVTLLQ